MLRLQHKFLQATKVHVTVQVQGKSDEHHQFEPQATAAEILDTLGYNGPGNTIRNNEGSALLKDKIVPAGVYTLPVHTLPD